MVGESFSIDRFPTIGTPDARHGSESAKVVRPDPDRGRARGRELADSTSTEERDPRPLVVVESTAGIGGRAECPRHRDKEDSMRTRIALLSAVAVFAIGWSAGRVLSQDAAGEKKAPDAHAGDMSDQMPKLGEEHKKLVAQVGEYTVKGKFWMDPKGEPMETNGKATFTMILGGHYQVQDYEADFMGSPYQGHGIAGYDVNAKEYFSTWIDSMSTGVLYARGKIDEKGTVTCLGEMADPMNPTSKCKFREVSKAPEKDSFTFEMWMSNSMHPEEFKCFELTYTRKK
jgi:hypothetical protein